MEVADRFGVRKPQDALADENFENHSTNSSQSASLSAVLPDAIAAVAQWRR
jgi:hypothetical protein